MTPPLHVDREADALAAGKLECATPTSARLEVVRQVAGVDPQPLDRPSLTRINIECSAPLQNQRLDLAQHLGELARGSASQRLGPLSPRTTLVRERRVVTPVG